MDTELIELNGFDILDNIQFMYCNMAMELNENKLTKIHNTMDTVFYYIIINKQICLLIQIYLIEELIIMKIVMLKIAFNI